MRRGSGAWRRIARPGFRGLSTALWRYSDRVFCHDFAMSAVPLNPYELTPAMLRAALPVLTCRECEVLRWMIHSKSDAVIGEILEMKSSTASSHAHHIYTKLNVPGREGAIVEAFCVIYLGFSPAAALKPLYPKPALRQKVQSRFRPRHRG